MNDLDFSNLPPKNLPSLNYINKYLDDAMKSVQEAHEERVTQEKSYRDSHLSLLRSIESNTANLNILVSLISKNIEQQDALIEVMGDILSIAKAKEKREAETKLQIALKKITETITNGEALAQAVMYAGTVFNMVIGLIGNK
jgi:hypothetical protein